MAFAVASTPPWISDGRAYGAHCVLLNDDVCVRRPCTMTGQRSRQRNFNDGYQTRLLLEPLGESLECSHFLIMQR